MDRDYMNKKEQDAFLRGYNAGLQLMARSFESGETLLGEYPRKVRSMSLRTIERLIRTYEV
jgi:hypothetical protein